MRSRGHIPRLREWTLADLAGHRAVFWSAGNRPTQLVAGLSNNDVLAHTKALYLLADRIVGSASYYFESESTRRVAGTLRSLFTEGSMLFFIDDAMESFAEHGATKACKSPDAMRCYGDRSVLADRARQLDSFGNILRRPAASISDHIVDLWTADLFDATGGTLGAHLSLRYPNADRRMEVIANLTRLGSNRETDFVWDYVGPAMTSLKMPVDTCRIARRRLSEFYARATGELLGIPVGTAGGTGSAPEYDSALFLDAMAALGVAQAFRAISVAELTALKHSVEGVAFLAFYRDLLHNLAGPASMQQLLPLYMSVEQRIVDGTSTEVILAGLREVRRTLGVPDGTASPTMTLRRVYEAFGILALRGFIERLGILMESRMRTRHRRRNAARQKRVIRMTATQDRVTVGIVTALDFERAAVETVLDDIRDDVIATSRGKESYVVATCPAAGGGQHLVAIDIAGKGNDSASARASRLLFGYPHIETVLMVGIAGAIPNARNPEKHVRLGDIVVSGEAGVIKYDFVADKGGWQEPRHPPRPPSARFLGGVRHLAAREHTGERPWMRHVERATVMRGIQRPKERADTLHDSTDPTLVVAHPADVRRVVGIPRVFVGPIASADTLLKNPVRRDELSERVDVRAAEMEASGIAHASWEYQVGFMVIRGTVDYCDSHKNDEWQQYAAVIAAAYTRALLEVVPEHDVR